MANKRISSHVGLAASMPGAGTLAIHVPNQFKVPILSLPRQMLRLFSFLLILLFSVQSAAQTDAALGQVLYRQHCKNCHKMDRNAHGPMLAGVVARWHGNESALKSYIKDAPGRIAAGDTIAVKIWKQWKHRKMPPFPNLNDHDLNALLAFIQQKR